MIQDFQTIVDFISRDKKEFALNHPLVKKEIQEFVRLYLREKGFYEFLIVDHHLSIIASKRSDLINKSSTDPLLRKTVQAGELSAEIEKSGAFFRPITRK